MSEETKRLMTRADQVFSFVLKAGAFFAFLLGVIVFFGKHEDIQAYMRNITGTDQLSEQVAVMAANMSAITATLDATVTQLELTIQSVQRLENVQSQSSEPSITFVEGSHRIDDGAVGDTVGMHFGVLKLRDCGGPKGTVRFIDSSGQFHTMDALSLLNHDNRMPELQVLPAQIQHLRFTGRIPTDEGITLGQASGWMEVYEYSRCPQVPLSRSQRVTFNVTE